MKPTHYLAVFALPISVIFSLQLEGIGSFLTVFIFFGFVPLLELFLSPDPKNFTEEESKKQKNNPGYQLVLYLAVPVQIGVLVYFLHIIQFTPMDSIEFLGRVSAMGIMCGVMGINIGHELGHRSNRREQLMGELLLLTSLNTHFLPYHNSGHHYEVATPDDAATAKKNQWLYSFWFTSHFGSYRKAWELENKRSLQKHGTFWTFKNRMVTYTFLNIVVIGTILLVFNWVALFGFIGASVVGILLLETVNYIEHYGCERKRKENGKYERVNHSHSWNSDHVLGRLVLFNLSRHSDHHYKASKPYQILDSLPESPQMPTGYPGMMLLSLIPPLWFSVMNPKIELNQL